MLIEDLLSGEINSRTNDEEIAKYASELEDRAGVEQLPDDPVEEPGNRQGPTPSPTPTPAWPRVSNKIKRSNDLVRVLNKLDADKLIGLYSSLTKVSGNTNTQLIAVGAWAFIESAAKLCGANGTTSFVDFFTKGKNGRMASYGVEQRQAGVIHDALGRLSRGGNTTKHDAISGVFDHRQVINDMTVITPLLVLALNKQVEE